MNSASNDGAGDNNRAGGDLRRPQNRTGAVILAITKRGPIITSNNCPIIIGNDEDNESEERNLANLEVNLIESGLPQYLIEAVRGNWGRIDLELVHGLMSFGIDNSHRERRLGAMISAIKVERDKLREKLCTLEMQTVTHAQYERLLDEKEALEERVANLSHQLDGLKSKFDELRGDNVDLELRLQAECELTQQLGQEKEDLKKKFEELEKAKAGLEQERDEFVDTVEILEKELEEKEVSHENASFVELEQIRLALNKSDAEKVQIREALEHEKRVKANLARDLLVKEKTLEENQSNGVELDRIRVALTKSDIEKVKFREALEHEKWVTANLASDLLEKENKLEEYRSMVSNLREQICDLERQLVDELLESNGSENEVKRLHERVKELEREVAGLRSATSAMASEILTKEQAVIVLRNQLGKSRHFMKKARFGRHRALKEVESLRRHLFLRAKQLSDEMNRNRKMKIDAESAQSEIDSRDKQIAELRLEIEETKTELHGVKNCRKLSTSLFDGDDDEDAGLAPVANVANQRRRKIEIVTHFDQAKRTLDERQKLENKISRLNDYINTQGSKINDLTNQIEKLRQSNNGSSVSRKIAEAKEEIERRIEAMACLPASAGCWTANNEGNIEFLENLLLMLDIDGINRISQPAVSSTTSSNFGETIMHEAVSSTCKAPGGGRSFSSSSTWSTVSATTTTLDHEIASQHDEAFEINNSNNSACGVNQPVYLTRSLISYPSVNVIRQKQQEHNAREAKARSFSSSSTWSTVSATTTMLEHEIESQLEEAFEINCNNNNIGSAPPDALQFRARSLASYPPPIEVIRQMQQEQQSQQRTGSVPSSSLLNAADFVGQFPTPVDRNNYMRRKNVITFKRLCTFSQPPY